MADYTGPVAKAIEMADRPVILLGHSMGGVTLSYLGERYADRICKLIYLTAIMLLNGNNLGDLVSDPDYAKNPACVEFFQVSSVKGKGSVVDVAKLSLLKAAFYADCSDHDIAVASNNICVNSLVLYVTRSDVPADKFGKIPRVFIECTADHAIPIIIQRKMQTAMPGTKVLSLDTSHSAFFSQPEKLSAMIAQESPG